MTAPALVLWKLIVWALVIAAVAGGRMTPKPRTAVTEPSTDAAYEHFHRWELLRFRWDLTGPFDAAPMVDWGCATCGLVVAAHHQPEARGGAR